jgi:DHA1 family multidrug resistance protein-like MFS transporter
MNDRSGSREPDRRTFSILLAAIFLGLLGLGIVIPLLPIFVDEYSASGFWVGALFAGYGLSRILFTPLIGDYSDRYGRKWFITGGLALYTVVSLLYLVPGSIYGLFAIRFVHGIASAMIGPVAMAYVGDFTPKGKEGAYQGRLSNAFYLGLGAGPLVGGGVYHIAGLETVFLLMSAMAFIPCLLCYRYLPESKPIIRTRPRLRDAFFHPRMQANLFFRFINCFPYAAFMVFLPVIAATQYGYTTLLAGLIIAIEVFSMGTTQGYFGRIADRYKRSHMIVAGTLLVSGATIALPFVENLLAVSLIAVAIGVGNAVAISAATAVVAIDGRTIGQGVAMGAFNTVVSLGITIPPLLFGAILVWTGVDAIFILAGILSLVSLVPFWYLVLRSRRLVPPLRSTG